MIVTPHALHFAQADAALEAGLDVLLEKPMVMNATEAVELIRTRDRTGRLLVVGVPGQPLAARPGGGGDAPLGRARARSSTSTRSSGRTGTSGPPARGAQTPALSGGGFMFDTGAHMLNTVADLAGEDVAQVAAWLEDDGNPVDVRGAVIARLASGALITMNGCGRAIPSLGSDIRVFCERGTLRTGIWGERLELQRARRQDACAPCDRCARDPLAAVPRRARGPRAQPEPARGRACGWRGCGTRSASRRRAAAPSSTPVREADAA